MLTTLLRPTAGTATVAGADLLADPVGVRRRIGYVPQAIGATGGGSDPNATVGEELTLQARLYRVPAGEIAARVARLTGQLDLAGLDDRLVKTLSGGQRRRLDIALGPGPLPAAGLPGRADHRAGPAEPQQPVGAHPPAARGAGHHGLPDHALPRRGGRPVRPDAGHRLRPDRRRGRAGGTQAPHLRRRDHAQRERRPRYRQGPAGRPGGRARHQRQRPRAAAHRRARRGSAARAAAGAGRGRDRAGVHPAGPADARRRVPHRDRPVAARRRAGPPRRTGCRCQQLRPSLPEHTSCLSPATPC